MKEHYKEDAWSIIEEGFHAEMQKSSESIFSLGNGRMGQRANFEEDYSGESLLGNYVGGVYYPDKTRVGWWKNGYPEYFAKVLNAANWIGIRVTANGELLDLATAKVSEFRRELNMKEGYLHRTFTAELPNGIKLKVDARRFLSMQVFEAGLIRYSVTPLNYSGEIEFGCYIDGDIKNEDSNYDEKFWAEVTRETGNDTSALIIRTKKLDFHVCTAQKIVLTKNGENQTFTSIATEKEKYVENLISVSATEGDEIVVYKYAANVSSLNHDKSELMNQAMQVVSRCSVDGFDEMLEDQKNAWAERWKMNDIVIEGDVAAQQAIRFNIFQLNQTYTGDDARLNIGPKGFTGEKYGGSTYWDTEAYCLPFYMLTAGQDVAKNLLLYRYRQLNKAIENGEKLGFKAGAALYPMVTMNGEECHNEWEITFEEIHRNGAIAYAIYNYIKHTGDSGYLMEGGLEVLLAISRFWSQRFNWSDHKKQYVMLGVTGPNEYENNVNNNWYTNYIARWTMQYTMECMEYCREDSGFWNEFIQKTSFVNDQELTQWRKIVDNVYEPRLEGSNIYLQQDGYLDKEDRLAEDLDPQERPINQHWSWDRILRSVFIKQADVLQGMYFFEDDFSEEVIRDNFNYYEPRTVHESSLSPCVHSVIASKLGMEEKAYEMYLRTARLDLDDYNHEADEGLHITSMAGTWIAVIEGFGGKRVHDGILSFDPVIPPQWDSYRFNLVYRNVIIRVGVSANGVSVKTESDGELEILIYGKSHRLTANNPINVER
ncbi:glycoside hydrolase family 65 protein [Cryomorpha ignava]|uniref:Glycoside hydrolase family 65 protein n=1 Tax=Cryomorpha ignava TaxID=101383 RepID=A0A7K3WM32_9FLAO|nr:family 65 glycosyl hydrolase domain-containing protein [Cryomorpha ignava]NEN22524.1 glycoside hydrolase family 65 protein [Cryomorpha ignava]